MLEQVASVGRAQRSPVAAFVAWPAHTAIGIAGARPGQNHQGGSEIEGGNLYGHPPDLAG